MSEGGRLGHRNNIDGLEQNCAPDFIRYVDEDMEALGDGFL